MARQKPKSTTKPAATAPQIEPLIDPDLYTQIAFVLTLALLIARAMMTESLRDGMNAVFKGSDVPRTISAGGILFLDALCTLPAILVLLRRVMDPTYVIRWTWSHVLISQLALWSACSIAWSSDKFLTLNNAANTMASAALVWSSAQLVRSWLRMRILGGICFGLLLFYAEQGLEYHYLSVPENIKFFNEHRDEIYRQHNFEPDSFEAKQFEHTVTSGEMIGFNTSPNAFAAVIVMLLFITAGIAIQRSAESGSSLWWMAIAVISSPVLLVLRFAAAKTSLGTIGLSAIALSLLVSGRVRNWLASHSRRAFWLVFATFWLGVVALVGHGIAHGSLPQDSLNFRWRYWTASTQLVRQHPVLGVGWGNFAEPYLAVRWPNATEEIHDPHNFIVRAFAELGCIGGFLAILWLARSAWEITRSIAPAGGSSAKRNVLIVALAGILLGVLLNAWFSVDFAQSSAYSLLEVFRRVLAAGLLTIGVIVATVKIGDKNAVDPRPAPWVLYGLLIALGAFFIHNLVEFVLAEPGPLTLFSILLGAAIGLRTQWPEPAADRSNGSVTALLLAAGIAWISFVALLVIPITDAEQFAHTGDDQIRAVRPDQAVGSLTDAFHIVPYNYDYAVRAARAMELARENPERIKAMLEQAITVDPQHALTYLRHAEAESLGSKPDQATIRHDYDRALALDPQNMLMRLDYADLLSRWGDDPAAAEQYQRVLNTNAAYDDTEPKRLPPEKVKSIEQTIEKLKAASSATIRP